MQVADYQSPTVLANCVLLLSYLSKVLKYSTKVNYGIQNFWCQCLSAFVAWWHILDLFPLNTEHFLNTRAHASLMVRRPPPRLSIQQTFKSRPLLVQYLITFFDFRRVHLPSGLQTEPHQIPPRPPDCNRWALSTAGRDFKGISELPLIQLIL